MAKNNTPPPQKSSKKTRTKVVAILALLSIVFGVLGGVLGGIFSHMAFEKGTEKLSINAADKTTELSGNTAQEYPTHEIVGAVADSVVDIQTMSSTIEKDQEKKYEGHGSGIILNERGYIATNWHLANGAQTITATLRNGKSYVASLVGSSEADDLALLKIDTKETLTPVVFEDSDKIKVGEKCIVIGSPLGKSGTVTEGIISALDREETIGSYKMKLLQTNAEINVGNSGGGSFDGQGECQGVIVAKSTGENVEGIGFIIPSNKVKEVVGNLFK